MRINHNIAALNTYNKLSANQATTAKSLEKLSSGLKINKAGDDAAGLAISEKMRGQIRGLDQASANASDGISLIKTAEGGLSETHSILQRMRELSVQSSNDTNTDVDRGEIQKEITQLTSEIDRISTDTEFNTQKLLNGEKATTVATSNCKDSAGGIKSSIVKSTTVDGNIQTGTYTATISVQNAESTKADFSQSKVLTDANGAVASYTNTAATAPGSYNGTIAGLGSITASVSPLAAVSAETTKLAGALNLSAGDYTLECTNETAHEYRVLDSANQQVGGTYTSDGAGALDVNGTAVAITEATADDDAATFSVTNAFKIGAGGAVTASGVAEGVSHLAVTLSADAKVGDNFKIEIGATSPPNTNLTKADLAKGSYQLVVSDYDATGSGSATITIQDSKGNAVKNEAGGVLQIKPTDLTADTTIGGITIQAGTISGNSTNGFEITTAQKATTTIKDSVGAAAVGVSFAFNDTVADGDTFSVDVDASNAMKFQIGANESQSTALSINAMGAKALGIDTLDLTTQAGADKSVTTVDNAISKVSSERAKLGAVQNRLEHTINNLGASSENATAAESRIRDVDMAKEMMEFTKNNILSQAAQSMLAQANQQPQGVLQLLQ